jgi:DNA-binding MarR family transcriptional regulator
MASVHRRLLASEHRVLRNLHQKGEISFAVMGEVRRELDLDEARFAP